MKKSMIALVLACYGSLASADVMTKEEVISTLKKNNLSSLVDLFKKGALILDTKETTKNQMQLKKSGAEFYDENHQQAKYWYRGMGAAETNQLIGGGYSAVDWNKASYVGITPEFTYSQSYLNRNNPGVVVEFGTSSNGWLYQQWSVNHKCSIKSEGGGTYGLGTKGTIRSCDKKIKNTFKGLGENFSQWMNRHDITTRVVWVLVPR